jgi:hypothetical protein
MSDTATPVSRKAFWAGWAVSGLPALTLLFSGAMKVVWPAMVVEEFGRLGYAGSLALWIGILELACTVVYLVPRTAVLGAILLTGYLGGAVATHVRVGDGFGQLVVPIFLGVLVWGGLCLRDARLRAILPLRG